MRVVSWRRQGSKVFWRTWHLLQMPPIRSLGSRVPEPSCVSGAELRFFRLVLTNRLSDPNWVDHHKGERRPRRHDPPRNRDELAPYPMRSPSGYRDDPRDYRGVPPPRDYRYDDIGRDFRSSRDTRPISPPGRGYSRDYDDLRGMPRPPPMSAGPYDARMPPDPRGFDVRGGLYEPRGPYGYPDYDRPPPPRDYPPTAAPPLSAGAYERGAPPYGAVVPPYMNGRTRSPLPYDT